jgi:hypothetical protein
VPGGAPVARPAVGANSLCQSLWAVVRADGSLARAGCAGTTSGFAAGGGYQVVFPGNVRNCSYVASRGEPGSQGIQNPGFTTVAGLFKAPHGVFVETFDSTGKAAVEPFHLSVSCSFPQRSGIVTISAPHTAATVRVPGGVSASTVIAATPRNDTGIFVVAAVPSVKSGTVTIHLSRAPRKGHPVMVGWIAGR